MRTRILIALAVVLLGALAFALWRSEWIREETDNGHSPEAYKDDLLATGMYLARHGIAARTVEVQGTGLTLPAQHGALVFLASRLALSDASTAGLRSWVAAGGHLITLSTVRADELLFGRTDPLLDELGIHSVEPEPENPDAPNVASDGTVTSAPSPEGTPEHQGEVAAPDADEVEYAYDDLGCIVDPIAWATLAAPAEELAFSMPTPVRLAARGGNASAVSVLARDAAGDLILSASFGRGRVTVLADAALWRNADVGCLDHARLLHRLIGAARSVVLVSYADRPSLFDLLQRHGTLFLAAAGALLALWLWHVGTRFGSALPSPAPARRQRAEAMRAAGEYLWRHRAVADLLAGVRQRVRRTARLRLGREDAIDVLAKRARISVEQAQVAMTADPRHERDLIATTNTLKQLIEQS